LIESPSKGPKARQIELRILLFENSERHFVGLKRRLPGVTVPLAIRFTKLEKLDA
jgi:hypothetical protein